MPHDIFISYSRKNLDAVKPIKEELEALGFSSWMDSPAKALNEQAKAALARLNNQE